MECIAYRPDRYSIRLEYALSGRTECWGYPNNGTQWLRKGKAKKVNSHDFPGPEGPKAHPYGIHEPERNTGFVNVVIDHDTATFAVASIRAWWKAEGKRHIRKPDGFYISLPERASGTKSSIGFSHSSVRTGGMSS
jgi:hypothetical protein